MKKIAISIIFMLGTFLAFSQDSGIVYGRTWSYLISAPDGWIWDSETLQKNNIWGLFYPNGKKFDPTKTHIYISPVSKSRTGDVTLEEFAKVDINYFKDNNPSALIKFVKFYETSGNNTLIYSLEDTDKGYYQYLGYKVDNNCSFIFVLTERSIEDLESHKSSFYQLLDNFAYMDKVEN